MITNYLKIILCFCSFVSLVVSGQNIMVIEKADQTTVKVDINDIKRVYFESIDSESPLDTINSIYICYRIYN